jgi:[acyl-carrier-protein] S-malonyltransferase
LKTIEKEEGICQIANDNAEGQVIVSGDKEKVELLQNILKEQKVKSIPLKVSAPFHCSLMKPAAVLMKDKIKKTNFKNPIFKIINNVTASSETNSENIKELLVRQIFSTVKWRDSIINMSQAGVKNFVEIGPGKVLTGMVKRTIKQANYFSINSISDIKNFVDEYKK